MWTTTQHGIEGRNVKYVVDVNKWSFEQLAELLSEVCKGLDETNNWPISQEIECMSVTALNLLNLQVF